MRDEISKLRDEAAEALRSASDLTALEQVSVKYLSRKGLVAGLFKQLGKVDAAERPIIGQLLNDLKQQLENLEAERTLALKPRSKEFDVDTTLPGRGTWIGSYHPLTIVMREITDIFGRMGFRVADGPEIELVKYNFDMLNTPPWHPSRDESDTIYLPNGFVVRTETSPVQVRTMEKQDPPVRIISPGRVYRRDRPDATHSPMFHQVEGLYVDKGVTMAELKGTLLAFYKELFGQDTKLRFRPHFFPFTEPSAEVDITCPFCKAEGCRICKYTTWLEMGGSGMVDPNVLQGVGYDPEIYSGFAFGLGIDRIAMLRFGIPNIRLLFDSDVRFLRQFSGFTPR
ncbi:MAG: phenylalanine--tRNA ligase subunit alpha [Calditrichaeota bacterium]|nr:phenylalanine--tRNA ligase subunit alpha [Calditrichota bacterium]MCB9366325.1 phenylalanine--tRNA ligase subunit alpha [Calditrichota bacterium]